MAFTRDILPTSLLFLWFFGTTISVEVALWGKPEVVPLKINIGQKVVLQYEASEPLTQQDISLSHMANNRDGYFVMFAKNSKESGFQPVGWGSPKDVFPRLSLSWESINSFTFTIDGVENDDLGIFKAEIKGKDKKVISRKIFLLYTEGHIEDQETPTEREIGAAPEKSPPIVTILIVVIAVLSTILVTAAIACVYLRCCCGYRVTIRRLPGRHSSTSTTSSADSRNPRRHRREREGEEDIDGANVAFADGKCKIIEDTAPAQCTDNVADAEPSEQSGLLQSQMPEREDRVFSHPVAPSIVFSDLSGDADGGLDEPDSIPNLKQQDDATDAESETSMSQLASGTSFALVPVLVTKVLPATEELKKPVDPEVVQSMYYSLPVSPPALDISQPQFVSALDLPESMLGLLSRLTADKEAVQKVIDVFDGKVVRVEDRFQQYRELIKQDDRENAVNEFISSKYLDHDVKEILMKYLSAREESIPLQIIQYPKDKLATDIFIGRYILVVSRPMTIDTYLFGVEYSVTYTVQGSPSMNAEVSECNICELIKFRALEAFRVKGLAGDLHLSKA